MFELRSNPFYHFRKTTWLNIIAHLFIISISITKTIYEEQGTGATDTVYVDFSFSTRRVLQDRNFMLPLDTLLLNLFVIIYQSTCEYTGLDEGDYW